MDTPLHDRDRLLCSGAGERSSNSDALGGQPISPKDERIVSATPSPNAALAGPSANATPHPGPLDAAGDSGTFHHLGAFAGDSGFGSSMGTWNAYPQYINADGLHVVSPVVYNDNPSLVFHSGYGYNTDAAYGQYSPVGTPLPHLMVDGQIYPGQQLPFSPSYFPPNMPHISSADPMTLESSSIDNMFFGPTSGFLVNYGNLPGNISSSPITSPTVYPQPVGILGAYENNFGQQRSSHGFGLVSSSPYAHGGSYQSNSYNGASFPYSVPNELSPLGLDKGRRRESDRDLISGSSDSRDSFNDRNRGPRASKVKGKMVTEQSSSSGGDNKLLSASGIILDSYNKLDFVFDYEDAKFFIIKSFSEDNVHKSIKYNVWASTPHGNKKLDAAYQEAKEITPRCPVFLFFSVNASGQFCGVAEMVGAVNFEKDAEYWQQDRWSGQFPVQWHIIKDVPNIKFRHILLENNDNKPVTHSRDSQEVGFKQGIEMLKIFKDHEARTSILEDFCFYDDREKTSRERKARQQQAHVADNSSNETAAADELSVSLSQKLVVEEDDNAVSGGSEKKRSSAI